ncbi:MAG: metallophosphoesterase family protein [Desulfobulbaceae bacterium]|nr:metallophosphoesterase family protein [Desulfobulbaceae bacterium]HIJ78156.1 CDP-archaeol synthase [Deltaproteobacteria bacterium]
MADALKVLAFLFWGNFLPPIAAMLLEDRFNRPLDNGRTFFDNKPLFGPHKTMRGIIACLVGGTAAFPLLGLPWQTAATAAAWLMAGDLLSSFIKRRLSLESGDSVCGLDQFFEGLFPGLYLAHHLNLPFWQLAGALIIFVPVAHGGALFWKMMLFRPPVENYPRIVRSRVRLREWRSCHQPIMRWHTYLNLSSFLYNRVVVSTFFKLVGLHDQGLTNARQIEVVEQVLFFTKLPKAFDGFKILLLTDLHLDGVADIVDTILEKIKGRHFDLCLVGGDIRMETYGPIAPCLRELKRLFTDVKSKEGAYGVLGNHDCIEMAPDFEEAGLLMLINDAEQIERANESIWLAGIDDPHYYQTHDVAKAYAKIPTGAFSICLAHSPEAYQEAARQEADLYLCGHTHGGQICLPDRTPIYTNSRAPRYTAKGKWEFLKMQGYTSCGVGASGAPLRFNCPGEICLITLACATSD